MQLSINMLVIAFMLASGGQLGYSTATKTDDSVSFTIRVGSADTGTETYKITSDKSGYLLTSTVHLKKYGEQISSHQRQRLAPDWSFEDYSLSTEMAGDQRATEASVKGAKIQMHTTVRGESKDKSIDLHSPVCVLDNAVPSHFQVLVRQYRARHAKQSMEVQLLFPQVLGEVPGTLSRAGSDTGMLRNRSVQVEKYVLLAKGVSFQMWTDEKGELLRVYVPEQRTDFTRPEFKMSSK